MIIIIRVSAVGSDRLTFTNELQIESVSQNIPVHSGFFFQGRAARQAL